MIVTKPDSVGKGRTEHVLFASRKRVYAVPLSPEMGVETERHLRNPCRLRAIKVAKENTVVVMESLSMGVVPGVGAVVEVGDEAERFARAPIVGEAYGVVLAPLPVGLVSIHEPGLDL